MKNAEDRCDIARQRIAIILHNLIYFMHIWAIKWKEPAGQDDGEEKLVHKTENKSNETAHFKACDFRGKFTTSTAKSLIHISKVFTIFLFLLQDQELKKIIKKTLQTPLINLKIQS